MRIAAKVQCRWNDKDGCVPSVIHQEASCMSKGFYECDKPCKWSGNIKNGVCRNTYFSDKDLSKEYKLVKDEIDRFERFKNILSNKSKTIVFSITERLNNVNKKLKALMEKEKKINIKGASLNEKTFDRNMQMLQKLKQQEFDLNKEKIKLKAVIESIKKN